jgi:MFS family permease
MELRSVLALPTYRLYASSRVAATIASSLLQAVVAWQVYTLTGSPLDLGLVGLVRFIPSLAVSFVSGAVVDTYDRKRVLMAAQVVQILAVVGMLAMITSNQVSLAVIYAMVAVIGVSSAFEGPARQVVLPSLVSRRMLPRALTVNSTLQSLSMVTGPAVGGQLIAWQGIAVSYAVFVGLVLIAIALLVPLHVPQIAASRRAGVHLGAIREGLSYVFTRPVVLGAMTLDLFAVLFGGAKALLPIYAVEVLKGDAIVYGILTASLEVGALLMAVALVVLPLPKETGRTLLLGVAAFGLSTIVFGLSDWLPLSIIAYAAVGAADQVSMVMRQNTIQLATPDHLRGRVTAVNSVFINASNQLNAVESGIVAFFTNAVFAVVSGGVLCLGVVGVVAWKNPELRRYRASDAPLL